MPDFVFIVPNRSAPFKHTELFTRQNHNTGFYTKGRPLVKSNLICPSDKLSWGPGCPVLNNNIEGIFCISQGNDSSDNLLKNVV